MYAFYTWLLIYILIYAIPYLVFGLMSLVAFNLPSVLQKLGILFHVGSMLAIFAAVYLAFAAFVIVFCYHLFQLITHIKELTLAAIAGNIIVLIIALGVIVTVGLPQIFPQQFGHLQLNKIESIQAPANWIKKNFLQATNQVDPEAEYNGLPIIFKEIQEGDIATVEALLDAGVDVDVPGFAEETPLLKAALSNQWGIAKLLLERGANIRAVSNHGRHLPLYAYDMDLEADNTYAQSIQGKALVRVRGAIDEAGIEHWKDYSVPEVKEMLVRDAWPPAPGAGSTTQAAVSEVQVEESSIEDTDTRERLDMYVSSNYSSVSLNLQLVKETSAHHIYQANIKNDLNTFFIYFVVPIDSTQSIIPTNDISAY